MIHTSRPHAALLAMVVTALGVLASAPAQAVDLPRYDVAAYCADWPDGTAQRASCRRAEEEKRVILAGRWESLPEKRRHVCVQKVQFLKKQQRSFAALHACLADDLTS